MSEITLLEPILTQTKLPYVESLVSAGFPSPAEEYMGGKLDLVQYLIDNPTATFYVRVDGESMIGAGIYPKDIVAVDRSKEPKHGDIVLAVVNNEFTLKRLECNAGSMRLIAENPDYPNINITAEIEFMIWGVVGAVCRKLS